ncbi:soluble NSF attachment protein gamma isoform [Heterostelium album PN500]|uniref:Gamma-soluble NSF attachment protein n=1 Tax=Heterostelium pallidum (strain ATCC 26659 / Pp 5 / PN500) TaxID=670386 RepID=D3BU06_HETP5|nr:soluble NSF attachment protein gamma isoform [Heterostelium album PN500]EFA75192.1 soluble NSF attachment protein gamma isoform [Heterostelium album PN500]|eukprot:XP_020427326.1 soluble NSF attachment protein gamma isoform [Heterostelium album PN500]
MSEKMIEAKKKEADAFMKEGDKLTTKTLLRWKCDWDNAAIAYEKAAKNYRTCKMYDLAKYCFTRLALCQKSIDVYTLAAMSMESASAMAKEMNNQQEAIELLVEASRIYRINGNSSTAADTMTKAAMMMEKTDVNQALELLMDSCEMLDIDDKEYLSGDKFKLTISMLLRHKKYLEAVDQLINQNKMFVKMDNTHDLNKSCLSAIVVLLAIDDVVSAKRRYEEFLNHSSFLHSQEGTTALELINAFDTNNAEAVKNIRSRHLFNFLDNQVAKIAKALTLSENVTGGGIDTPQGGEESVL